MKRKLIRLSGYLIMFGSIVIGIGLMGWVFGVGPINEISKISNTMVGAEKSWKIFCQVIKMFFGIPYSFAGMIIIYRTGLKITKRYR